MRRVVSVWLPLWPIERMRRRQPASVPDDEPFALVENTSHGIRITAVNRRAAAEGVRAGMALSDARAGLPALATGAAEVERDRAALLKLARWLGRYGPARNISILPAASPLASLDHGLWVDVAGVEHLHGGEAGLLADLTARLRAMGLSGRMGLADTSGAAWALARYGSGGPGSAEATVAAPRATQAALADLPVEALRLTPETAVLLRRLGLRRIGQLYDLPRSAVERRFRDGASTKGRLSKARRQEADLMVGGLLGRLDEVLGRCAEALEALAEPPVLAVRRAYAEPFISSELLVREVEQLARELCAALADADLGARHVRLALYRADGTMAEIAAGTSAPSHDARHLMRLMAEKLGSLDAGFGIDGLALETTRAEPAQLLQGALSDGAPHALSVAELVDHLANRLGPERVSILAARDSHIPERAEVRLSALAAGKSAGVDSRHARAGPPRPSLLLARPEPIEVMAEVPEGAPLRFTWRRLTVRVVRAEGPERIAPEWWREIGRVRLPADPEASEVAESDCSRPPPDRPRDYYRVEAEAGGIYWVFRHGLYGGQAEDVQAGTPRWFLHGLYG